MKVALLQMQITSGAVPVNRRRGLEMVEKAAAQAEVLVLPEIWTTGYQLKDLALWAEEESGYVISELRHIARLKNSWIIAGSMPLRGKAGITNTMLAIAPDGTIAARYDKIHMFSLYGEGRFFQAGSGRSLFSLAGTQTGLAICYDLRFPELFRSLALAGAELVVVAAEWPEARSAHWRLLNQARAIENQLFVVAVNCVGEHKGLRFGGQSLVVAPDGAIVAEGTGQEEIILADLDISLVEKTRQAMSVWQDRRPELYL
ncbi:MAG: carbon-nitrogen family hydrolase [Sporomusaceae bacterium]|nr:carbon-nitrogen family hydrolase [Sporomusaceae bacterium]